VLKTYEQMCSNWIGLLIEGREELTYEENELYFTIRSFRKTLGFIMTSETEGYSIEKRLELIFKIKVILCYLCRSYNIDLKET